MPNSSEITQKPANKVLLDSYAQSKNFYHSDHWLTQYLEANLEPTILAEVEHRLEKLGSQAAGPMNAMSLNADKHGPQLVKRNALGETIDQVVFHPDYQAMMRIAIESGMFSLKWQPQYRSRFAGNRHKIGFALGYLYAMSESGQYCPLCMTDGVALLLDHFAPEETRRRLVPRIASEDLEEFASGAMFLTEKQGGSDVGANQVEAVLQHGDTYKLYGEKWFCSNVNAEVIFALARTNPDISGTKGLSIFLIEPQKEDGSRNDLGIVRLKDKLGVRSMASGECVMNGTEAKRIGPEFQGFRIMAEMINLSRLYNSVAALAGGRRALIEAWQFLNSRLSFGKVAVEHALVRAKFWELGAIHLVQFHLVWRAIEALDAAENGNESEAELLRVLTPMIKRSSAEAGVYLAREGMELMGGMGYIEDTVMPKIMRDVMVLPIWEGAGNIMVLDMLRASVKSGGLMQVAKVFEALPPGDPQVERVRESGNSALEKIQTALRLPQDEMEWAAKKAFLQLTDALGCAILVEELGLDPAVRLSLQWFQGDHAGAPPSTEEVRHLIGWT